jgi:TonB dependent receptor-like, beta-barrel/CarboxypepD_reg-like domain
MALYNQKRFINWFGLMGKYRFSVPTSGLKRTPVKLEIFFPPTFNNYREKLKMRAFFIALILWGIILNSSIGFAQELVGTIEGKVVDSENMQHLVGVNIIIADSDIGCTTDAEGNYKISKIKVGSYRIIYSYIGYEKVISTDVIVRSGRITYVNVEMKPSAINMQKVSVTAGYFNQTEGQPLSATSFSFEEIRRAPGAGGDVSRIIFGLPSQAKINDTKNSLIVRGGSAVENGFFLDNIEIPNINHFPVQGSTEGPIGIINVDLIDNVNFYSGGFSSSFGDRLSSIMDLKFREGDRSSYNIQADMSLQGFGGVVEGPINNGKGSFVLSARRSYLDMILKLMNEKVGLPIYSDIQGKVVYDLDALNKISFIDVFSDDNQKTNQDDALDNKNAVYIDYKYYSNTAGLNWRHLWGKSGYSNTSFAHTYSKTNGKYFQTRDAKPLFDNNSLEEEFKFRNTNHLFFNNDLTLEFGFDAKSFINNYNQFYNEYRDLLGQVTPELLLNQKTRIYKSGAFVNLNWEPVSKFTINPGMRIDYYSYNQEANVSPRLSITYNINDVTSLTGTAGIYYQNIPQVLAAQKDEFKKLSNPKAYHYIIGLSRLLTESTKLTIEAYDKEYYNFPMDPSQPNLFVFDQAVIENVFMAHQNLISSGKANSKGIEVTVQKKLAKNFYGLIAASYSKAKYMGLDNKWYDRIYDNRFTFAIEGGYKPNEKWEFSVRWIFAGGAPYTPFNEEASRQEFKGVFDKTKVNSSRLPDFHSLNIRADRRFNFQSSSLIVYLSIWNAYARENISTYSWSEIDNKVVPEKMWGMLPVFGIEYEF